MATPADAHGSGTCSGFALLATLTYDPAFGSSLRLIRYSLRYAWGEWHWQGDAEASLHRFHQNAHWGDVNWLELEIAGFLLVHQMPFEAINLMDDDKHYALPLVDIVPAQLPVRAYGIFSSIIEKCASLALEANASARRFFALGVAVDPVLREHPCRDEARRAGHAGLAAIDSGTYPKERPYDFSP